MTEPMELQGKAAIVTGGGHGIGRAIAESCTRAKVVVADVHVAAAKIAERTGGSPGLRRVPDAVNAWWTGHGGLGPWPLAVSNAR
jgi:NAD(P)-dependent dehydrogenase (short-subunit alcohol dehydrogenase family)